ncbi:archaetidylserine decarboxylase [Caldalkalibacillus salinus]|uniref:archaetidylserine decarboxylase n=1 Tax=Caldalkalibacillus salinus TaxID=2803787 RepID=UPI0019238678|nr:archaetidylserine decarboxylase [Caldalkalibacillus salinus]
MKPVYKLLTELSSKKLISSITGKFAKSKLSRSFIQSFAQTYQINIDEAEKRLEEYPTLNAFFTRRLKEGARAIDERENTLVSPVDARITGVGQVQKGTILDIKGQSYTIAEMLQDDVEAAKYQQGTYIVLYLSPTDYHRIHAPLDGAVMRHVHLKGKVYPVNDFGLTHMPRVLSRNERLITYMKRDQLELAVVKVGAMNVSSIQLSDQLQTTTVKKGDELAYFEFGSTVVLLIQEGAFVMNKGLEEGNKVHMGEAIGSIRYK